MWVWGLNDFGQLGIGTYESLVEEPRELFLPDLPKARSTAETVHFEAKGDDSIL
jgi:hypothetical protein